MVVTVICVVLLIDVIATLVVVSVIVVVAAVVRFLILGVIVLFSGFGAPFQLLTVDSGADW